MKLLNKKWKKIIFIGGISVVSLYSLQLLIPLFVSFSASSTKDQTNSLKFLSYNVQFGANDESVQVITQCDADIVALQELTNIIYEGSSLTISEFATLLSYDYYAIPTISEVREYGLAILSRYNITYSQLIPVRYDDMLSRGMLIAEINVNDTIVIVINTHLDVPYYYIQRYQQDENNFG